MFINSPAEPSGYVVGLADDTNKWVIRFSIDDEYIEGSASLADSATSFTGVVRLTAGSSYYFGFS